MVRKKGKRQTYIIAGSILAVIVLTIGIISLVKSLNANKNDPYAQVETTNTPDATDTTGDTQTTPPTNTPTDTEPAENDDATDSTVDPDSVSVVDIKPMNLAVSYIKGVGGFEFFVMRTANGTQYVEFSNQDLKGTKCTDDTGVFASIVEAPRDNDSPTLSKTTTVDGVKYGLSLADETCTKDPDLLKQYQASFSDAFSLLKAID